MPAPVIQQTMWKQSLVVYILRKSSLDTADHPLHTVWYLNKTKSSPAFCIHLTRVKLFYVLTHFLQNIHSYKTRSALQQTELDEWPGFPAIYFPWLVQLWDHYTGDGGIAISLLVHWSPSRHMQTCKRCKRWQCSKWMYIPMQYGPSTNVIAILNNQP